MYKEAFDNQGNPEGRDIADYLDQLLRGGHKLDEAFQAPEEPPRRMLTQDAMAKLAQLHPLVLERFRREPTERRKAVPPSERSEVVKGCFPQEIVEMTGQGSRTALFVTNTTYTESGGGKILLLKYAQLGRPTERRFTLEGLDVAIWFNGRFKGSIDIPDYNLHRSNAMPSYSFESRNPEAELSPEGERVIKITLDILDKYQKSELS